MEVLGGASPPPTPSNGKEPTMRSLAVIAALILGTLWVFFGFERFEDLLWQISRLAARGEVKTKPKAQQVEKVSLDALDPNLEAQLEQMMTNFGSNMVRSP